MSRALLLLALFLLSAAARADDAPLAKAQRLAWAGVRIDYGATTLLIDAIDPASIGGAGADPSVPIEHPGAKRFALVTHTHTDHFDAALLKAFLGDSGTLVCDARMAPMLAGRGFKVVPVELWHPIFLGLSGMLAIPVPAMDATSNNDQVSWVVIAGKQRFFHGGDTQWHNAFHAIGAAYGPFDAAFLPVNGADIALFEPRSHVPMTLTPPQAVAAADALHARLLVPIHYGKNDPPDYVEYPELREATIGAAKQRAIPLAWLAPGEWVR